MTLYLWEGILFGREYLSKNRVIDLKWTVLGLRGNRVSPIFNQSGELVSHGCRTFYRTGAIVDIPAGWGLATPFQDVQIALQQAKATCRKLRIKSPYSGIFDLIEETIIAVAPRGSVRR